MKRNESWRPDWRNRVTIIVLLLFILSSCVTSDQNTVSRNSEPTAPSKVVGQVVNIKHNLPVRQDPSLQSEKLGKLFLGDAVVVDEEQIVNSDNWYRITSTNDNAAPALTGWVLSKYIEKTGAAPTAQPASQKPDESQKDSTSLSDNKALGMAGNVLLGVATVATGGAALLAVTTLTGTGIESAVNGQKGSDDAAAGQSAAAQKGYHRVAFSKIVEMKSQQELFEQDIFTTAIFEKAVRSPQSGRGVTGYVNLRLCDPDNQRSCHDLFLLEQSNSEAIKELARDTRIRIFGTMRPKSKARGGHFYIARLQKF